MSSGIPARLDLSGHVIKSYELREMIGQGSFGAVYKAYHPPVKRDVAIKIILPQYANHLDFIRRFEAEAQLVARVEHPYIVPLYDYWREPDSAYIVMRYLRGGNLRELLNQQGALELDTVTRILDQVAAALTVAHQQGVIHRDIKPANVMLDEQGNAYLADFGIAKDLNLGEDSMAGAIVGSPSYLSPEQVQSLPITAQSDIYSLGVVVYEMLTGERAFTDPDLGTLLVKQITDPMPDLQLRRPDLPERLNNVLQRVTSKDPANRYQSAAVFAAAFRYAIFRQQATGDMAPQTELASFPNSVDRLLALAGAGDPSSLPSSLDVAFPEPENPYKGLRPFQEADAPDFFGRGELVLRLLDRLREAHPLQRFLAVVGPSGSGKSSVIKAGVMPSLRAGALPNSDQWFLVEMVPGKRPFEELSAALLRVAVNPPTDLQEQLQADEPGLATVIRRLLPTDHPTELFLFIDQFEEIFTQVTDDAERERFLNLLLRAVQEADSRLWVVITIRADFYDRPLLYAELGEALRQRTEVVLPLSLAELEAAIVGPAERVGVRFEEGLAGQIAQQVGQQPGALPLLQYALTELFTRRDGYLLPHSAYEAIGGVTGALAQRAEDLYQQLNPRQQEATRQIFLRLVTLGEGVEDTRRRVHLNEIEAMGLSSDVVQEVLENFGRYRLLTFDHDPSTREPTVEVAHEALIRQWERLRGWINTRRDGLRLQRRLLVAAQEWQQAGQDRSFLLRGTQLEQFEEWYINTDLILTDLEKTYLHSSVTEHEAAAQREFERQQREAALEQRSRRFLMAFTAVSFVGLVVASLLAAYAFAQRGRAREEQLRAEANADRAIEQQLLAEYNASEAQSLSLIANARNALNENEPNFALALAVEASRAFQPPLSEVRRTLASTAYAPGIRYRWALHKAAVRGVSISPDGRLAASGDDSGLIVLWDVATGQEIRRFQESGAGIHTLSFNPTGTHLLAGDASGMIRLWEISLGEQVQEFQDTHTPINVVIFHPDGTRIISGAGLTQAQAPESPTPIRIWSIATGELVDSLNGHTGGIHDLSITPDGRYLASSAGSLDRSVRVWNLERPDNPHTTEDERQIFRRTNLEELIHAVDISEDGEEVAAGSFSTEVSGVLRIWDVSTGILQETFYGHTNIISGIFFDEAHNRLVSSSWDRTLRVWDLDTGIELQRYAGHAEDILSMAMNTDSDLILLGTGSDADTSLDTSAILWDLRDNTTVQTLTGHQEWVWTVDSSPDGRFYASGGGPFFTDTGDTSIRLWDAATGEEIRRMEGHQGVVHRLRFSPDGQYLVSGGWDGLVILWDVASGEEIRRFEGHEDQVLTVAWSPNGRHILSGAGNPRAESLDNRMILWDAASGEIIRSLEGHSNAVNYAIFSPDGAHILSASEDNSIRLWDAASGEEIRRYTGHNQGVLGLDFAPQDSSQFVSSGKDGMMHLWDTASGELLRSFSGHNGQVLSVHFHPNSNLILSGGSDATVRLWELASGEELRRYDGHRDWVVEVDFIPSGELALSGSDDKTLRVWRVDTTISETLAWAQANRYIPELSCAQKAQFNLYDANCPSSSLR